MLDWRLFLLSAALPWPFPSQTQLLKTLQHYRAVDTTGTGLITQEQYAQVELWFPSERDLPVHDDPTEPLRYDRLANLKKSVPYIEGAGVEECEADKEEEREVESDEVGVSMDDVLRVLSHGDDHVCSHLNRFQPNHRSRDELREELLKVFKELGFKDEEKIPFSTLSQHPFLQDLMEGSSQYLLPDIHKNFPGTTN
ncbi:sperm flagellar 2 [Labeo rohita]|uniref:Sperm flagellar 2 n=1 Tax=Labeo rohita TaxID=84645 RepID=A0A498NRL1_LABRO|nr:sperm flagellar 2 [Labeo rohita]